MFTQEKLIKQSMNVIHRLSLRYSIPIPSIKLANNFGSAGKYLHRNNCILLDYNILKDIEPKLIINLLFHEWRHC